MQLAYNPPKCITDFPLPVVSAAPMDKLPASPLPRKETVRHIKRQFSATGKERRGFLMHYTLTSGGAFIHSGEEEVMVVTS